MNHLGDRPAAPVIWLVERELKHRKRMVTLLTPDFTVFASTTLAELQEGWANKKRVVPTPIAIIRGRVWKADRVNFRIQVESIFNVPIINWTAQKITATLVPLKMKIRLEGCF